MAERDFTRTRLFMGDTDSYLEEVVRVKFNTLLLFRKIAMDTVLLRRRMQIAETKYDINHGGYNELVYLSNSQQKRGRRSQTEKSATETLEKIDLDLQKEPDIKLIGNLTEYQLRVSYEVYDGNRIPVYVGVKYLPTNQWIY